MDPKLVLQAQGQLPITASSTPLPYYGILWTDSATPFSITTEDYFGQVNTWNIDKSCPAIAPRKVTAIAPGNQLFLLHNRNSATLKE